MSIVFTWATVVLSALALVCWGISFTAAAIGKHGSPSPQIEPIRQRSLALFAFFVALVVICGQFIWI